MNKFRWNFDRTLLFAPDNKDTGGEPDTPPADNAAPTGDEPGTNNGAGEAKFTQADVDRIIDERLRRDRQKREADADRERQAAADKALAEQQKFQELAEQRAAKIAQLEPVAGRYDELSALVMSQIEAEVKGWPEKVKNLLPDEPTDVLDFMKSVAKFRPLVADLKEADTPPPGSSRGPKPRGAVRENREITPVIDIKSRF